MFRRTFLGSLIMALFERIINKKTIYYTHYTPGIRTVQVSDLWRDDTEILDQDKLNHYRKTINHCTPLIVRSNGLVLTPHSYYYYEALKSLGIKQAKALVFDWENK